MDDVSAVIGQDLELDVMRVLDEFLDVYPGIAEGPFRLGPRGVITLHEGNVVMGNAHAPSAAAGDGFNHDRIANSPGIRERLLFVIDNSLRAGWRRYPSFLRQSPADCLVLQCVHRPRTRPDKPDVAALAHVREMSVLGQEPVAWMDGVHVGDL